MRKCIVCDKQFAPCSKKHVCCSRSCRVSAEYIKNNAVCLIFYCVCAVCGKLFVGKSENNVCCNDDCRKIRYANKLKMYQHTCDVCGKNFKHKGPNVKRCSPECSKMFNKNRYLTARKCLFCGQKFHAIKLSKKELCDICVEKQKRKIKNSMPFINDDLSFRNRGLLEGPTNMWYVEGFSSKLKEQIKERDGWKCYICGKTTNLHIHHIIPRKEGGEHTPDNLVTLCGGCHRSIESGNMEKAIEKCIVRAMDNTSMEGI